MSTAVARPHRTDLDHRVAAINNYDMWFVAERIGRDRLLPEPEIEDAIVQFKRFASLVAIGYPNLTMPVKNIDVVWHTFLLFTEEYEEFCLRCIGSYLHHKPTTSKTVKDHTACVDFYEAYKQVFDEDLQQRGNEQATCCGGGDNCRSRVGAIPALA